MTDNGLLDALAEVLAPDRVLGPEVASEDYSHDECLTVAPRRPAAVVLVESTAEVSAVVKLAAERKVPITARGSGTGLSGAAIPAEKPPAPVPSSAKTAPLPKPYSPSGPKKPTSKNPLLDTRD